MSWFRRPFGGEEQRNTVATPTRTKPAPAARPVLSAEATWLHLSLVRDTCQEVQIPAREVELQNNAQVVLMLFCVDNAR